MAHQGENIPFAESQLLIDKVLNHSYKEYRYSLGHHTVEVHAIDHHGQHTGAKGHTCQGDAEKGKEPIEKLILDLEGEDAVQNEIVDHSQGGAHDVGQDVVNVKHFVKHIKQPHVHDQADDTYQRILDKARV